MGQLHASGAGPSGDLTQSIRPVPPDGSGLRDFTPLLADPGALRAAVEAMADHYRQRTIDAVAAIEAGGFLFATPLALELQTGLIPIRKRSKLPFPVHARQYRSGPAGGVLEMHCDAVTAGQRVLLVDDLLATGDTMRAGCALIEQAGARVAGCACLVELATHRGRRRLQPYELFSVVVCDD